MADENASSHHLYLVKQLNLKKQHTFRPGHERREIAKSVRFLLWELQMCQPLQSVVIFLDWLQSPSMLQTSQKADPFHLDVHSSEKMKWKNLFFSLVLSATPALSAVPVRVSGAGLVNCWATTPDEVCTKGRMRSVLKASHFLLFCSLGSNCLSSLHLTVCSSFQAGS